MTTEGATPPCPRDGSAETATMTAASGGGGGGRARRSSRVADAPFGPASVGFCREDFYGTAVPGDHRGWRTRGDGARRRARVARPVLRGRRAPQDTPAHSQGAGS